MNKLVIISLALIMAFFVFNKNSVPLAKNMPQHQLTAYKQNKLGALNVSIGGKCSVAKCLTIYVAPWCSQCTKAKPMIVKLTRVLRSEGVNVAVIVGSDSTEAVTNYAKKYPFPVYLDADEGFYNKTNLTGVPFFISSNKEGKIIQEFSGFYDDIADMRADLEL